VFVLLRSGVEGEVPNESWDSKFDAQRERIEELLRMGVSVRKIAHKHLGLKNHAALNTHIKKRICARRPNETLLVDSGVGRLLGH
jgi:hypothetical protein